MRTRLRSASVLTVATLLCSLLGSCVVGPQQLRRSIDDWDHQLYVNSPWLDAGLWIIPVIPVCTAGALVGDFLVTNPYHFWLGDAWDGNGTGFKHLDVEHVDGYTESLLIERSGWTRSSK